MGAVERETMLADALTVLVFSHAKQIALGTPGHPPDPQALRQALTALRVAGRRFPVPVLQTFDPIMEQLATKLNATLRSQLNLELRDLEDRS